MNILFTQFFFDFKQIQVTSKVIKGSKISTPNKKDEMHQIETLKVEDTRNPKGSLLYLHCFYKNSLQYNTNHLLTQKNFTRGILNYDRPSKLKKKRNLRIV
jgi:hypothetical protein